MLEKYIGDVSYRVTVVPALESLQHGFVTPLTSLQLTFENSTNYTIEVVASALETVLQLH